MYWENDASVAEYRAPDTVIDVSYRLSGRSVPLDHAYALRQALEMALPWLADEEAAGIHAIHVATSGNGWLRPSDPRNEYLHLSRRTRLTLRLRRERIQQASGLEGETLIIEGHALQVGACRVRSLSTAATQFARYVVGEPDEPEDRFIERVARDLAEMEIPTRRLLCGMRHTLNTPEGTLHTRSVLVARLSPPEATRLQERGVGPGRKLGCGLFFAHKGIDPVRSAEDDTS